MRSRVRMAAWRRARCAVRTSLVEVARWEFETARVEGRVCVADARSSEAVVGRAGTGGGEPGDARVQRREAVDSRCGDRAAAMMSAFERKTPTSGARMGRSWEAILAVRRAVTRAVGM